MRSYKAYAGCSRIIATIQRASSTELPAESGEKRRRAVPVKVRPVSICFDIEYRREYPGEAGRSGKDFAEERGSIRPVARGNCAHVP